MQQMLSGRRVAAIVSVAARRSNTISAVQFQALLRVEISWPKAWILMDFDHFRGEKGSRRWTYGCKKAI